MDLAKPYTITHAQKQSEDIDRMFDELYRALGDLSAVSSGGSSSSGSSGSSGNVLQLVLDGIDGSDGLPGPTGPTGPSGPMGPQGLDGQDGLDGIDGLQGPPGPAPNFTTGSVVFQGTSGSLAQDNANFFWADSTNRLGIGTASPIAPLTVQGNVSLKADSMEAWDTNFTVLKVGSTANFMANSTGSGSNRLNVTQNAYNDGSWKYEQNGSASLLQSVGGFTYLYNAASGTADAAISFAQGLAFTPSGDCQVANLLDIASGTAGRIAFPAAQNSSTNVNTLDDYEEGSWTPTITGATGASGQTYTTQVGIYTKIGQQVLVGFNVVLSALGTITGNVQIGNLPFSSNATTSYRATCPINWSALTTAMVFVQGQIPANSFVIPVFGATGAVTGSTTALVQGDLSDTTAFRGSLVYTI